MNLFAKIFLGFWLSTVAIIGSWLIAGRYFDTFEDTLPDAVTIDSQRGAGGRPGHPPDPPKAPTPFGASARFDGGLGPRGLYRIYYGLQNVPREQLEGWIRQRENEEQIDIRLVNEQGIEIFDRELFEGSAEIIARLEGFRRRAAYRDEDKMFFGQELYRPEWGTLRMIIATRPHASPIMRAITENLWLRLLLALLISGGISYGVSRYLTRPLKQLQQASRELANGNLSARIKVTERHGDETDALARDFNSMAEQLEEKISAQRRLLSDVSHELRSPLARMQVALALAEREPGRSAAQLQRIERETILLDKLIDQLLSTPDTPGEMEDSLDLVVLLQTICDDAAFEARARGTSVKFTSSVTEAVLRTHGDLLKSAFENIIRNALRYSPEGAAVEVSLKQQDNDVFVTVKDHGPGVPPEDVDRIFEPFYRVDEARQRETGGFGLGLSISRRAIEQHGGHITASNRHTPASADDSHAGDDSHYGGGLIVSVHLPSAS